MSYPDDDFMVEGIRSIREIYVLIISFGLALAWPRLPGAAHRMIEVVDRIARVPVIIAEAVKADGRANLQRAHLRAVNATGAEVESSLLIDGTDWASALDIRQAVLLDVLRGLEREGISLAHANAVMPAATGANS